MAHHRQKIALALIGAHGLFRRLLKVFMDLMGGGDVDMNAGQANGGAVLVAFDHLADRLDPGPGAVGAPDAELALERGPLAARVLRHRRLARGTVGGFDEGDEGGAGGGEVAGAVADHGVAGLAADHPVVGGVVVPKPGVRGSERDGQSLLALVSRRPPALGWETGVRRVLRLVPVACAFAALAKPGPGERLHAAGHARRSASAVRHQGP